MTISELKAKLELLDVPSSQYSLDGSLIPDAIILYENYFKWEVFYFDERGGRHSEKIFDSEGEACEYIYKLFLDARKVQLEYGTK